MESIPFDIQQATLTYVNVACLCKAIQLLVVFPCSFTLMYTSSLVNITLSFLNLQNNKQKKRQV